MTEALNQRPPANASDADEDHEKTALRRHNERLQREIKTLRHETDILRQQSDVLRQENLRLTNENNALKTDTNKRLRETKKANKSLRGKLAKFSEMFADSLRAGDGDIDDVDDHIVTARDDDDDDDSVRSAGIEKTVTSEKHKQTKRSRKVMMISNRK